MFRKVTVKYGKKKIDREILVKHVYDIIKENECKKKEGDGCEE